MGRKRANRRLWLVPVLAFGAMALLFVLQPSASSHVTADATPQPGSTATAAAGLPDQGAPADPQPFTGNGGGFSAGDLIGITLRLLLVVAVILGSLYLFKVWTARGRGASGTGATLRLVETLTLGNQRAIYLVDAGEKVLVVGATSAQVNLLAELSDPETLASLRVVHQSGAGLAAATDLLKRTGFRFLKRPEPEGEARFPTLGETVQRMLRNQESLRRNAAERPSRPTTAGEDAL